MAEARAVLVMAMLGATLVWGCVTPLKRPKPTYAVRPVKDSAGWTISTKGGTPVLERRFVEREYEIHASLAFDEDAQYTSQKQVRPPHPMRLNICGLIKHAGSNERISFDANPIVIDEDGKTLVGRALPSHASLPESQRICGRWQFDTHISDNWPGFSLQLRLGTFSDDGNLMEIPPIDIHVSYDRMFECVGVNCSVMH